MFVWRLLWDCDDDQFCLNEIRLCRCVVVVVETMKTEKNNAGTEVGHREIKEWRWPSSSPPVLRLPARPSVYSIQGTKIYDLISFSALRWNWYKSSAVHGTRDFPLLLLLLLLFIITKKDWSTTDPNIPSECENIFPPPPPPPHGTTSQWWRFLFIFICIYCQQSSVYLSIGPHFTQVLWTRIKIIEQIARIPRVFLLFFKNLQIEETNKVLS